MYLGVGHSWAVSFRRRDVALTKLKHENPSYWRTNWSTGDRAVQEDTSLVQQGACCLKTQPVNHLGHALVVGLGAIMGVKTPGLCTIHIMHKPRDRRIPRGATESQPWYPSRFQLTNRKRAVSSWAGWLCRSSDLDGNHSPSKRP